MAKPDKQLPTRRVAFGKQLDLLRGYAAGGADGTGVTNEELSEIVGLAPKTASLVNTFFADVGLIFRTERGSAPAPEVVNFQRAHQWGPDDAAKELAPVFRRAWFFQTLKSKLTFGPLSEHQAVALLGQEADAGQDYRPELRLLLDFMEVAKVITRDGGMVTLAAEQGQTPSARPKEPEADPVKAPPRAPDTPASASRGSLPLLIQGLLEQLPKDGRWTSTRKKQWLEMASLTFDLVYAVDDEPSSAVLASEEPERG